MGREYKMETKRLNEWGQEDRPQDQYMLLISLFEEVRRGIMAELYHCSNKKLEYFVEKQFPK